MLKIPYFARAFSTAFFQPSNSLNRVSSGIFGVKILSAAEFCFISSVPFHTPLHSPARYAAPKAVVYATLGRTASQLSISD